jgi:hypothetical protein
MKTLSQGNIIVMLKNFLTGEIVVSPDNMFGLPWNKINASVLISLRSY